MSTREFIKGQIDILPESVLDKVQEFISFQRYILGLFEDDTQYLESIPGMVESIKVASAEPLSECVPLSEVWPDV